jgi:putative ABC transport system permease protein
VNLTWLAGLVRRRTGRLAMTATGIALAVALIACLGAFLTTSRATMTARATRSVAVDWQVESQAGADPAAVLATVSQAPGNGATLPVSYLHATGLSVTSAGSTQQTGAAVLLGMPEGYRAGFPDQIRQLTGSATGVLVAQQTAANLHAAPGDSITVGFAGHPGVSVTVAGVVDLPQANSLFQKVGAPTSSQPNAPPDNVLLLPQAVFATTVAAAGIDPAAIVTQIHVRRTAALSPDPATAYVEVTGAAHNLESKLAGSAVVGDDLAAALDAARKDAAYAQIMFLFLGVPGAVVAALLTSAVAGAGADRRRREQALLRTRGIGTSTAVGYACLEAVLVAVVGAAMGLLAAAVIGGVTFGANPATTAVTTVTAAVLGLAVAAATIVLPAVRDLRRATVMSARGVSDPTAAPLWARLGVDVVLLAAAGLVFWASGADDYTLVLAPEGVSTISVSYWAFLGPALFWVGAALLLWRLATLVLTRGRSAVTRVIRPVTGRLASTAAATMARRSAPLARSVVLLALAVSFAASTATFNATYRQQAEADAQLTNGADVTVTEPPGAQVGPQAAATLAAVPGVTRVEAVQHRFAYIGADLQDLYGVNPASITQVTALQDAYFVGGTASQLMAILAVRPDAILVSDETVKDFQLSPGDVVNLRLQDATTKALKTVPFHYAGIVKEFPTAPKDSFFIANAAYISRATGNDAVGAFLVDTAGTSQVQVAADVRALLGTGPTVTDLTQTRSQVGSSLTSVDLAGLTRIELGFAAALAAASAGIVLALGLAERRRTFAIATVLGATTRQRSGLVLAEATVVTGLGLAGGAAIGWVLSQMLVAVLTGVFDPPPTTVPVPWGYLSATVAFVVVAVGATALQYARKSLTPPVELLREL